MPAIVMPRIENAARACLSVLGAAAAGFAAGATEAHLVEGHGRRHIGRGIS